MGSESGEVVAGKLGQSQEKWWQVHGVTVRVWKSGGKHLASESGKVVANIHGIIV